MRIERRLEQPWWLTVAVPVVSIVVAFAVATVVLGATHHSPLHTFRRLFDAAFLANGALTETLVAATPLAFTGLAAAVAFRMNLFNIGGEGQLYAGAITGATAALLVAGAPSPVVIALMMLAGAAGDAGGECVLVRLAGGLRRADPRPGLAPDGAARPSRAGKGVMTAAGLAAENSARPAPDWVAYLKDAVLAALVAALLALPLMPDSGTWSTWTLHGLVLPLGAVVAVGVAVSIWVLYSRTRFGFEVRVIGDSARAGRYAGMRTRRKILAVMCLSGAIAGLGGASQDGDFRHQLDPRGLTQSNYGYTGIVVAALARYNPFAVVLIAFLLGGLQNAGYTLQGADFPNGLVGVLQGLILFCALGGELFVRYRVRLERRRGHAAVEPAS